MACWKDMKLSLKGSLPSSPHPTCCFPKVSAPVKLVNTSRHNVVLRAGSGSAGGSGSAAGIRDAISFVGRRDEQLLQLHGIHTLRDLEQIHFDLHLANARRTRHLLEDVVGIHSQVALQSILAYLGADDDSLGWNDEDEMAPYENLVLTTLASYAGLSLDRLQNMLLASSVTPKYDKTREQLFNLLDRLVMDDKLEQEGSVYRHKQTAGAASGALGWRGSNNMGLGGLSPAPTRSQPPLTRSRSSSRLSPGPSYPSPQPTFTFVPAAARTAGVMSTSGTGDGSVEELTQFEGQILDLLQNYSGLTVERLEGLLFMSGKEPKFTQGTRRLQLLMDGMVAQGTVLDDGGVYRYVRRTPEPEATARNTSRSPQPFTTSSSSSSSSRNGDAGRASRPRDPPGTRHTPSNGLRASGRKSSSPSRMADIGTYQPAVLDLLQNYAGLSLERLDSLLASSPKAAGYQSSPALLSQLLQQMVSEGRISSEAGMFKYRSHSPTPARGKTPSEPRRTVIRPSPSSTATSRSSAPPRPPRASSPAVPARMEDISVYEPAVLDLLQNYSSLTLDRLDSLLAASPRAPGYVKSPSALARLLSTLQAQGRILQENGVYRYRPTGRTPVAARARSPSTTRGPRDLTPMPALTPAALSSTLSGLVDKARTTLSKARTPDKAASATPPPPPAQPVSPLLEDWSMFENTVLTMVSNYGALPLERIHDSLKMAMVWPRYDKSPAELSSYLAALAGAGKLVMENGLYRRPGSTSAALPPTSPAAGSLSISGRLQAQEERVLSTLAGFPGLTLERLHNILRLSKGVPHYDLEEEQLASLLGLLMTQGKVVPWNGLYKISPVLLQSMKPADTSGILGLSGSPSLAVGQMTIDQLVLLNSMGFPTKEGVAGFTPFVEVWNGRWAMVGIAASVFMETRTGAGTLAQVGLTNLPSTDLYSFLTTAVPLVVVGAAALQGARYAMGKMPSSEQERYQRLLSGQSQPLDLADKFFTDELVYVRKAEILNGRIAMVGFLFGITMEALTGRGILGQLFLYLKVVGLLDDSYGI